MPSHAYTKRIQPNLPSFSTVVTQNMSYLPLQLPMYCFSYVLRYRPRPPRCQIAHEETLESHPVMADDAPENEATQQVVDATALLSPLVGDNDGEIHVDVETCTALQKALEDAPGVMSSNRGDMEKCVSLKKIKNFSTSVIDLALTVIKAIKSRRSAVTVKEHRAEN